MGEQRGVVMIILALIVWNIYFSAEFFLYKYCSLVFGDSCLTRFFSFSTAVITVLFYFSIAPDAPLWAMAIAIIEPKVIGDYTAKLLFQCKYPDEA